MWFLMKVDSVLKNNTKIYALIKCNLEELE